MALDREALTNTLLIEARSIDSRMSQAELRKLIRILLDRIEELEGQAILFHSSAKSFNDPSAALIWKYQRALAWLEGEEPSLVEFAKTKFGISP